MALAPSTIGSFYVGGRGGNKCCLACGGECVVEAIHRIAGQSPPQKGPKLLLGLRSLGDTSRLIGL